MVKRLLNIMRSRGQVTSESSPTTTSPTLGSNRSDNASERDLRGSSDRGSTEEPPTAAEVIVSAEQDSHNASAELSQTFPRLSFLANAQTSRCSGDNKARSVWRQSFRTWEDDRPILNGLLERSRTPGHCLHGSRPTQMGAADHFCERGQTAEALRTDGNRTKPDRGLA
eukprot:4933211-Prymnesium_polylepis.1